MNCHFPPLLTECYWNQKVSKLSDEHQSTIASTISEIWESVAFRFKGDDKVLISTKEQIQSNENLALEFLSFLGRKSVTVGQLYSVVESINSEIAFSLWGEDFRPPQFSETLQTKVFKLLSKAALAELSESILNFYEKEALGQNRQDSPLPVHHFGSLPNHSDCLKEKLDFLSGLYNSAKLKKLVELLSSDSKDPDHPKKKLYFLLKRANRITVDFVTFSITSKTQILEGNSQRCSEFNVNQDLSEKFDEWRNSRAPKSIIAIPREEEFVSDSWEFIHRYFDVSFPSTREMAEYRERPPHSPFDLSKDSSTESYFENDLLHLISKI